MLAGEDWRGELSQRDDPDAAAALRSSTSRGRPLGSDSFMNKRRTRTVMAFVLISTAILLLAGCWRRSPVTLEVLRSSRGVTFTILAERDYEITRGVSCLVKEDGRLLFRFPVIRGYANHRIPSLSFQLWEDKAGYVFALVEESEPHVVLAIYDSRSSYKWYWRTGGARERKARNDEARRILEPVQEAHPDILFVLDGEVP